MTPDRWRRVQEVFAGATEREPAARAAYLDEACSDDGELRTEVESLLSALQVVGTDFLESPAIEGVPALFPGDQGETRGVVKGTRLGPYEIVASLGAGGMGEVYRARDERLGREVAIKVLAPEFSHDASRVKRFEKEARSASALNHPNIVTVYEFGSVKGLSYIAMERVDGETLGRLVAGGPVPIKKLLAIAFQIADGLARAHEAGIVHRDLKPENVMVTKDGLVKILDFGLAKLVSTGSGSDESSKLPNMSATNPGVILGTVGYMSPEQAGGESVDFRSDQFSFGSILFEMATGKRAFQGRTPIDVLGAILNDEPQPISELNPNAPMPLRWIIDRCLAKEPRQRYSSTDDLARDLATLRDRLSEASGMALAAVRTRGRRMTGLILGTVALAIAGVGLTRLRPAIMDPRPIRFAVEPPKETGFWGVWAFSPNGSTLAFIAAGKDGPKVWLRPMSSMDAQAVQGTEKADSVFWSPDGKSLGFFANGKLWRVEASGGVPAPICDAARDNSHAASWGADGQILFSSETGEAIYRVSSSGAAPSALVRAKREKGETQVLWPWFLPDGRRFLYLSRGANGGTLMLAEADGSARTVIPMLSRAEYVDPGYLVFARGQTLLAQRFDVRAGTIAGEPISLAEGVAYEMKAAWSRFATSREGGLAFQRRGGTVSRFRLAWFDRAGNVVEVGRNPNATAVAIDPQGRRALFSRQQTDTMNYSLWILDLERKVETRVAVDETSEVDGRWLPDGKSIVYSAEVGGLSQLRRRDLDTGKVTPLLPPSEYQEAGAFMPGGTQLAFTTFTEKGVGEVRLVSLSGDQKSSPFAQTGFNEGGVQISPDGRFLAFARDDAGGRDEVYVAPMTDPAQRTRISFTGVKHGMCLWSHDGREIFYLSLDRQLMAIPIRTEPVLSVGDPKVLLAFKEGADWDYFDASPDGKRFLAVVPEAAVPEEDLPMNVYLNWTAERQAQGPAGR